MSFGGTLEKMEICPCTRKGGSVHFARCVKVMINPESYRRKFSVVHNNQIAPGTGLASPVYDHTEAEVLSFELVFDATGVLPSMLTGYVPSTTDGVDKALDAFKGVVLAYKGSLHSPNYVRITWGSLVFEGVLTDLLIAYTLFKPDGTPLRARADCTFQSYTDPDEARRLEDRRSPDLTHLVTVQEGETLPLLCDRVYGDSSRYLQVARVNGLRAFRTLEPGLNLYFPPLSADF